MRPLGIKLLAALLASYAMGGFYLAASMIAARDPRLRWPLLVGVGALFAVSAGVGTLAVWRRERRGPRAVIACGVLGAVLCLAIPASAPRGVVTREMWQAAALAAVLFLAFLAVAAWYVRRVQRPPG